MAEQDELDALWGIMDPSGSHLLGTVGDRLTGPAREENTPSASVGLLSRDGWILIADEQVDTVRQQASPTDAWWLKLDLDGGSLFSSLSTRRANSSRLMRRFADTGITLAFDAGRDGTLWTTSPFPGSEGWLLTTGAGPNNALAADDFAVFMSPNGVRWLWSSEPPVPPQEPAPARILVHTFWWGFHFKIPVLLMDHWNAVGVTVAEILNLVAGFTGPAAPFVSALATYIAANFQLAKQVDQGYGVYVSMSWFAPAVFVPTPIKLNEV
jgi:hypothetical protein